MTNAKSAMSQEYKDALESLLFQLADDDFMYAYRGSEWLGLAPHIEADIAFSSISQDTMGHAAMYYQLLEDLGAGNADHLAHFRPSEERKNSILLERVNGEGYYMETPHYDWAYAVVRSVFYTYAKKVKLDSLCESAYSPLADVAVKVRMELYYHKMHWDIWFKQLLNSTDVAKKKMIDAIDLVLEDFGDVFSFGSHKQAIEENDLISSEEELKDKWKKLIAPLFQSVQMTTPIIPEPSDKNGRNGKHTSDLEKGLATLSEVNKVDSAAIW